MTTPQSLTEDDLRLLEGLLSFGQAPGVTPHRYDEKYRNLVDAGFAERWQDVQAAADKSLPNRINRSFAGDVLLATLQAERERERERVDAESRTAAPVAKPDPSRAFMCVESPEFDHVWIELPTGMDRVGAALKALADCGYASVVKEPTYREGGWTGGPSVAITMREGALDIEVRGIELDAESRALLQAELQAFMDSYEAESAAREQTDEGGGV